MLSTIGRISTVIVLAGGFTLLGSEAEASVRLDPPRQCTVGEESELCSWTQTYWYHDSSGYWCGTYGGNCLYDESEDHYSWDILYWNNGEQPCPPVQPC